MSAPKRAVARAVPISSGAHLRLLIAFLFLAFLLLAALRSAHGEGTPTASIAAAGAIHRATPAENIAKLQKALATGDLSPHETGKAWYTLAIIFEDQSRFAESRRAFESAIRTFSAIPADRGSYAMALDEFGSLNAAVGELDQAAKLRTDALHVYEEMHDHSGMAVAYNNLAGLALGQHRLREGKKLIEQSEKEMGLASNFDDEERASIYSMEGLLARLDGEDALSIASQQKALDLWKKLHGEESSSAGLGYVLLGIAYCHAHQVPAALETAQRGVAILERTAAPNSPVLYRAKLGYAQALDAAGQHQLALKIRDVVEQQKKSLEEGECARCTVSAVAFRDTSATPQH